MKKHKREKQLEGRIKLIILAVGSVGALLQGIASLIEALK